MYIAINFDEEYKVIEDLLEDINKDYMEFFLQSNY